VQRTRVLLHVVDCSGLSGRDPALDLQAVRNEVAMWDPSLLERPQLVAASKRDVVTEPDPLPALRREAAALGLEVLEISAVTGAGLERLRHALRSLVDTAVPVVALGQP
jgi:GTP-binding protein